MTIHRQLRAVRLLLLSMAAPCIAADVPPAPPALAPVEWVVRAGQMLDVMVEDAELRVVARATALASGHVGDVVRARLEANGRVVLVRVTGPGTAQLDGLKP